MNGRILAALFALLLAPALALAAPDTVKSTSKGKTLIDAASGESFVRLTAKSPAKFWLSGPAKYQVDFRVILPAKGAAQPTVVLTLLAGGKPVKAYRIAGKPGTSTWKGEKSIKSSISAAFFIETTAAETWELKLQGGDPLGAAVSVVPAEGAKNPIAANSPVLKSAIATTVAAAASTPAPRAPDPRASAGGRGALSVEAGLVLFTRMSAKRYDLIAPGISLAVWRPLSGERLSLGAGLGWRHLSGGRAFGDYQGRVLPPYVLDVDAVPIEALARWRQPRGGILLRAQAGLGLQYARSSHERADDVPRRTTENDWAATASLGVGAERPYAGGRLGVALGFRFARHAFAAHDFDSLHGTEIGIGYTRSF